MATIDERAQRRVAVINWMSSMSGRKPPSGAADFDFKGLDGVADVVYGGGEGRG